MYNGKKLRLRLYMFGEDLSIEDKLNNVPFEFKHFYKDLRLSKQL